MNWAAFGFKCAATDFKLGADLINIGSTMLQGAGDIININGNIASSMSKIEGMQLQLGNIDKQIGSALKAAGDSQEAGRLARESRMVKLGVDKSTVITTAAGSGIDVSSSTVNKVLKDTIKSAYNDSDVMARNERDNTQAMVDASESAKMDKAWMKYNIKVEQINQDMMYQQRKLSQKATNTAIIGGALSAASNWFNGMADAMGSLGGGK